MQNKHIRLLIVLMAVSLTGLVLLQYRWIKEAIAVKEARFDQTVNEVMQKVVYKMEKLETAKLMWTRFSKIDNTSGKGIQITLSSDKSLGVNAANDTLQLNSDTQTIFSTDDNLKHSLPADTVNNGSIVIIRKGNASQPGGAFLGVLLEPAPQGFGPGVLITQVVKNSPAKAAGLKEGDIITALDSVQVFSAHDIQQLVSRHIAGDEVKIRYKRPRLFYSAPALSVSSLKPNNQTSPKEAFTENINTDLALASDTGMMWLENLDTTALATLATKMEQNYEHIQSLAVEMMVRNKPFNERFDRKILETTLNNTLADAGIDIPYNYCLRVGDNCAFKDNVVYANCKPSDISPELLHTPYRKTIGQDAVFSQTAELLLQFPQQKKFIFNSSVFMLGSSLLFNLIIMAVFAFTMHTIIRQKKLSDMKTDFINNMTHELKTPISTIKLACELLTDKNFTKTENRIERYAGIIQEENHRLQDHVEKVLQYARLEKGNLKLNLEPIDMNEVLNEAAQKTMLRVNKQDGSIHTCLEAAKTTVNGDIMHLTNVIYNLLDNAVKYAKPDVPPEITISTYNADDSLVIAVTDNGIGMGKETINKIFEQFYRVPTGNIHNVKGFGLGLSYAKLMVEHHGGSIKVSSRLGKGSTFEVRLPLMQ